MLSCLKRKMNVAIARNSHTNINWGYIISSFELARKDATFSKFPFNIILDKLNPLKTRKITY